MTTLNEYMNAAMQTKTKRFAVQTCYQDSDDVVDTNWVYPALKLCGEAGEVVEKLGKIIRDKGGKISEEARLDLLKELGDVLWYVTSLADDFDSTLSEVANMNIEKLSSRSSRGVIHGSGDNR